MYEKENVQVHRHSYESKHYTVSQLVGGGASYWYLLAPCGRIVDTAHEDNEHEMSWLYKSAALLNNTLIHEDDLALAA